MNNKCKHLKQCFNNKLKCGLTKKETTLSECKNCIHFERKPIQTNKYTNKQKIALKRTKTPLKQKSNKLAKLEKNRYSIITNDLSKCIVCGSTYKVAKHEVFYGRNRLNSIKYGLIIPLCTLHHTDLKEGIHYNEKYCDKWQKKAQKITMQCYNMDKEEFMKIFGRNYLD